MHAESSINKGFIIVIITIIIMPIVFSNLVYKIEFC